MSKYKTANFRIRDINIPSLVAGEYSGVLNTVYTTMYVVEKRYSRFWWRTEKYRKHSNDGPGYMKDYIFATEKEALEYINKTPYTTKVLWK